MIYKQIKDKEQLEYFKSIVPGHFTKEISDLFYEKYGIRYKKSEIENIKRTYGLYSNITHLKRGTIKINRPPSPEGTERIHQGYIEIKHNGKWIKKHRYIYENQYGKVSNKDLIIFLDGNKMNCNLNNLKLIDRKTYVIANKNNLIFKNKVLTESGLLLTKLLNKNKELEEIIKNERL